MVRREGSEFCPECGTKNREKYRPVYCSRPCRLKAYNRKAYYELGRKEWHQNYNKVNKEKRRQYRRSVNQDARTKAQAKRRALQYSTTVEDFEHEEVFERDGWICGICTELVDSMLTWPDPMSKSLDHIQPLIRGGTHTLDNVQLAHLTCNIKKSDKMGGD